MNYYIKEGVDQMNEKQEAEKLAKVNKKKSMTDGSPVTPDHREINPVTGQQKGYVVLTNEEREKGFIRPVRDSYIHSQCGNITTMAISIAETYARDPTFYGGTFCSYCKSHFPVDQFTWKGSIERVGS